MGSVNIDNTGSGADVTLSSDGTDLLLDGTAIGGGGGGDPDLYSDSANGSAVTPTSNAGGSYNSVAIGNGADIGSGRGESIAIGTDALTNQSQAIALGKAATVGSGGSFATALGRNSLANGTSATAIGTSYASGSDSFAAAISTNSSSYGATGASSIAMGYQAKATQSYAFATGYQAQSTGNSGISMGFQANAGGQGVALGYKGRATGGNAFGVNNNTSGGATGYLSTAIGDSCLASGNSSVAMGLGSQADAAGSVVLGSRGHAQGIQNRYVFSPKSLIGSNDGASQYGVFVLIGATTDATAKVLTTNNTTAGTDDQIILPNNSAYAFHGTIVARESATDGTECAAWKVEGLIRREGSAGTTVLVNSATTVLDNTPSWGLALSADTTNGGLKVEATGAASTNIRWVSTIHTTEVTYA